MKPLATLLGVACMLIDYSCCYNQTDFECLRDLWLKAVTKTNESSLLRQSLHGDDFERLLNVLERIEPNDVLQDMKTTILKNSYESTVGMKLGLFTNFCGPGNHAGPSNSTVCGLFSGVDQCCKAHDACDDYIVSKSDYTLFPGLPQKQLYFTSLSCGCDVAFYNCIKQTATILGDLMLSVYSVAQASCFQYEYKIEKCMKYDK
jgi:Phospholipase A2